MRSEHLQTADRRSGSRVSIDVRRRFHALVLVCAAACGGPPKPSTPKAPAGTSEADASDTGSPGSGSRGDEEASIALTDPSLTGGPTPPGLDLSPGEKKSRVSGHVANAQKALKSATPDVETDAAGWANVAGIDAVTGPPEVKQPRLQRLSQLATVAVLGVIALALALVAFPLDTGLSTDAPVIIDSSTSGTSLARVPLQNATATFSQSILGGPFSNE